MENNYLTTGDLAFWDQRGYGYNRNGRGVATTGLALATGLGGGALLLAIAGLWGLNKASEARNQGVLALASANNERLNSMCAEVASERTARETWQMRQTPSIQSYIDVQASPHLYASNAAYSAAEAAALAQMYNYGNNSRIDSAVASSNYLRVQPISVKDCGCGCNG